MVTISAGKYRVDQQPTFDQPPRDLDLDGFFEDFDGDGEFDQSDAFHHLFSHDEPALQQFTSVLDFDHDGTVDFEDTYELSSRDTGRVDRPLYDEYVDVDLYAAEGVDTVTPITQLITTSLNGIGISPLSWTHGALVHQTVPSYPELHVGDADVVGDTLEELYSNFRETVEGLDMAAEDANILLHPTIDNQEPAAYVDDQYGIVTGITDIDLNDGIPLLTEDFAVTRPLAALYSTLGIDGGDPFEATITRNGFLNGGDDHAIIAPPTVDSKVEPDDNDVYYSTILPDDVAQERRSST